MAKEALVPSSNTSGAHDSRDLNRDGSISSGEQLAAAAGAHDTSSVSDTHATKTHSRDLNRDDHSVGEKFAGATGSHAAGAHDLNRDGKTSTGNGINSQIGTSQIVVSGDTHLLLYEEQLVVSKRQTSAGEICIRKRVQEEQVQQSVPVTREEFVVERRALTGVDDSDARAPEPDEISRVTLYREEIVRHRRLVPTEEVIIRKKIVTEHEIVGATLRSEHVETKQLQPSSAPTPAIGDYDRVGHVSAGEKLETTGSSTTETNAKVATADETHMTLHEEQLVVAKREINAGDVEIFKRVQEEHVQQSVPLKREELVVQRRPLTGGITDVSPEMATPDEIMRFILYREEIVIKKHRVPTEEIIVRKKIIIEHETVNDTLRWEQIETEQLEAMHGVGVRDASRDDVSAGEKLKQSTTATVAAGSHDQDDHFSAGEKLQAASGTKAKAKAARG
jgi:uncharacterized protein (TIGR02271 family)